MRKGKGALALALAFGATITFAAPAQADPEGDKEAAREHLATGDGHLARGEKLMGRKKTARALEAYEKALDSYEKAFDAYPDSRIYFAIGLAEQKLGRFVEALEHYEQMMESDQDLPEEMLGRVKTAIAEVKKQLAGLDLRVNLDGAAVSVDGVEIGISPLKGTHYMPPGRHTVTVSVDGALPFETEVDVPPGEVESVDVELEETVKTEPPDDSEVEPETPEPEDGEVDKLPLWIGLGATAAFGIGAVVTGSLAVSRHNTFNDTGVSETARESARDSGRKLAIATDVLVIATLAAGAYSAYYYYTVVREDSPEEATPPAERQVRLVPYATPDGAGVGLTTNF